MHVGSSFPFTCGMPISSHFLSCGGNRCLVLIWYVLPLRKYYFLPFSLVFLHHVVHLPRTFLRSQLKNCSEFYSPLTLFCVSTDFMKLQLTRQNKRSKILCSVRQQVLYVGCFSILSYAQGVATVIVLPAEKHLGKPQII